MNQVADGIGRKKLNTQQSAVLSWLLKYRFSTTKQIAAALSRTNHKGIQTKLQILEAQNLIGKRYAKSYRLAGRGAEYYLTPKGMRVLTAQVPDSAIQLSVMKALYKNKTVSDEFLKHCIGVVDAVLKLQSLYGDKLGIYSSYEIRAYSYFPKWTPDLFLSYKASSGAVYRAFLDIWDGSKPFFVSVRKMRNYITFAEEGDWLHDQAPYPSLLAICATTHDQQKLNRQIKKTLIDSGDADETPCGTTTHEQFAQATEATDRLWTYVSWDDDLQKTTLLSILRKS